MKDLKGETKRIIALLVTAALIIVSFPQDTLTAVAAQIDEESEVNEVTQSESDTVEVNGVEDAEAQTQPSEENVKENAEEQEKASEKDVTEDAEEETKPVEEEPSEEISDASQEDQASEDQTSEAQTETSSSENSDDKETEEANLGNVDESADTEQTGESAENDIIAQGIGYQSNDALTWILYNNGELVVEGEGEFVDSDSTPPWYNYRDKIESATVKLKGSHRANRMFAGCNNLKNVNLKEFDTTNVFTAMAMFSGCSSLTTLDLSSLNTANINYMDYMFSGCSSLTTLDLSTFNTAKVGLMTGMFYGCSSLKTLNLSSFDTSGVRSMQNMFNSCSSLETLDLSTFVILINDQNESEAKNNCGGMLTNCDSLKEIMSPKQVEVYVKLPEIDKEKVYGNYSWRMSDGTKVEELPMGLTESVRLATDKIGISFEGSNFKLSEYGETNIEDIEKIFDKGAKDSFTFTIVPDDGYNVKPTVEATSNLAKITIAQGDSPYQYIVKPSDMEQGYIHDEVISIKMEAPETHILNIDHFKSIENFVVVNGETITENAPSSVQVSNEYDTTVYVRYDGFNLAHEWRIPTIRLTSESGAMKRIKFERYSFMDSSTSTEMDMEMWLNGYDIFHLGRIYENTEIYIDSTTACNLMISTDGFPQGCRIIGYFMDSFGKIYREQEYEEEIILEAWEDYYIQVKWSDTENTHKWCRCQVSKITDHSLSPIEADNLYGIEGEVWKIERSKTEWNKDILIELKPHVIDLGTFDGDIVELVTSEGAKLSEDGKSIEVYGGDSLSIGVTLNDGLKLNGVSVEGEGEVECKDEGDGKWTITLSDMSRLYDINKINFDIVDELNRLSLADPKNKLTVTPNFNGQNRIYNGKEIYPAGGVSVKLGNETLERDVDYKVSYNNNINAGSNAEIIISAAPDSAKYRGRYIRYFSISKADSIKIPEKRINVEGDMSQIDLSEQLIFNGAYDQDVKPIEYSLESCEYGDVLDGDPLIEESLITYFLKEGANKDSKPAKVTLNALFENYETTKIVFNVYVVKREELALGGNLAEDKIYDGREFCPNVDGLQVFAKEGNVLSESEASAIRDKVKNSLDYRYKGTGSTVYSSDKPPVDVGTYKIVAKIADDNTNYKSEYFDAGTFQISQKEAVFAAKDVTICIGDSIPDAYDYTAEGMIVGDVASITPLMNCGIQNTEKTGDYTIRIDVSGVRIINAAGKNVTANYHIVGKDGSLRVEEAKPGSYTVTYSLCGKGKDISRSGIASGSLIPKPSDPTAVGYVFLGWYVNEAFDRMWDFSADIIQDDTTLYAGWAEELASDSDVKLYVQEILPQTYTGKAIKPVITVYDADSMTPLKNNKDYKIVYKNNVDADTKKFRGEESIPDGGIGSGITDTSQGFDSGLAYAMITGKGNYTGTLCVNFHIAPYDISNVDREASGITLKYTEGFEEKSGKNAAIVTQFKTKTSKLKFGTDYTLNVKKASDNTVVTLNDKGQLPLTAGIYKLRIEGKDNYTGAIEKELYVASKSQLIKNAKITCAGTISNVTKKELEAGVEPQNLQVSMGGTSLTKDTDYEVLCSNNNAIGTATVTVTGKNNYFGSKSITFKIKGTAFKEKEFGTVAVKDMTYTGEALMQNDVLLTKNGTSLTYGEDYTISYKNNIKKGKATMVFTAKPSSGYSGSFKKTFSINARNLSAEDIEDYIRINGAMKQADASWKLIENVSYQKGGATPSDKVVLRLKATGEVLTEGKGGSYTVTYSDNKTLGMATMTLKGIGNYTGNITISFNIIKASIAQLYKEGRVSVTAAPIKVGFVYSKYWVPAEDGVPGYWADGDLKDSERKFEPAITIKDVKTKLIKGVDYDVSYFDNMRKELEKNGSLTALITGKGDYGASGEEIKISVTVNRKAFSGRNIKVEYEDEVTYTGMPIEPQITKVLYNIDKDEDGTLIWEKLNEGEDYILEYSKNILKGSGTIKIIGIGDYSGSVTKKFKIKSKEIYAQSRPEEK